MTRVEGIGPSDARVMLVGEASGETEEKEGRPFVGQAGRILNGILEETGLKRDEIYITNVYKYHPKNNDFSTIKEEDLSKAYSELEEEIMRIHPNILILAGNEAMQAVLGHKGISFYRGSVLETKYGIKCIPIIHPAAIGREWTYRPITVLDFHKVKRESEYAEIRRRPRSLSIAGSILDITNYFNSILRDGTVKVSFDIEVETSQINCIGFATSSEEAFTIPFWFGASGSLWGAEEELKIWQLIKDLLEDSKVPKIAQNAQYDMTILADKYAINVSNLWLDTMIAFHAIYPELPKGLGFLTSIYTDVPYYKYQRKTEDMTEFFRYNATDACVTYECAEKIWKEMEEFGVRDFYREYMHSLIEPIMSITKLGVRIDSVKKVEAIKEYQEAIQTLQAKLDTLVGHPINVNSSKQMKSWLYKEMKLPTMYKLRKARGEKTESTDEDALEHLYAITQNEALKVVLEIREKYKILSTYLEMKYDKEKNSQGKIVERARTSYLITGTETGRLSSRQTVYRTGGNLQNVPKGIARRIFVADEEKIFVNADLSQAEARVVAYLAEEDRLIRVFENGGDIHRKNAANIFGKSLDAVNSKERELAKRIVHASNYGMGPITFAREVGISVSESKRLLNSYFAEYPKIKLWHMQTASRLKRNRTFTTPFGRKRTFFERYNTALIKEALAYIPQSTVADLLNLGLRRVYEKYKNTPTQILLQIHDAIMLQTPQASWKEVAMDVKQILTIPICVGNKSLVIPVDISVGENWDELKKI